MSLVLYGLYRWALPKPLAGIPYNKEATTRLMGDLPDLSAYHKSQGEQRQWFPLQNIKLNSPICQVFIRPFGAPRVLLTDFRETQDIFTKRLKEFDRGTRAQEAWEGIIPHMMLSYHTTDPRFRKHREIMKDLMSPSFLTQISAPEIYSKVDTMVQLWQQKAQHAAERSFDGKPDIQRAALDAIVAVSFGLDEKDSASRQQLDDLLSRPAGGVAVVDAAKGVVEFPVVPLPKELEATLTVIESVSVGFSSPIPRWHHWYLRQVDPLKSAAKIREEWTRREIDKAVKAIIEDGSENASATRSALEFMVLREAGAAKKAGRPPRFHRRMIYDELFGYIIAGHDTTSATLAIGFTLIADAPDVQAKLRSIIRTTFASALAEHRQPTVTEITSSNIPYLDAVIEENLRCGAVVPIITRNAMVDTTILGHAIPKGTQVYFLFNGPGYWKPEIPAPEHTRSASSQKSKDRYGVWNAEDVGQFVPERWIDVDENGVESYNPNKGPFHTFGGGIRGCFGKRLAYIQLRIFWVLLIWNFEFLPVAPEIRNNKVLEVVTTEPVNTFIRLRNINY